MNTNHLIYFTRTPLHVGAGSSVGAIDMLVARERHTQFPIIPGSGLKGVFADAWNDQLDDNGKRKNDSDAAWLFGSEDAEAAAAGALLFGEARLLAFPVRSLKNSFAWITCPLILKKAVRDGLIKDADIPTLKDEEAYVSSNKLKAGETVILEEYSFKVKEAVSSDLTKALKALFADDVWQSVDERLVIVSDEMMSYFCKNACEVQQRIKIDNETGVVAKGALFNQENVPAETLFYSVLFSTNERTADKGRSAEEAITQFKAKLVANNNTFQFGGDAGIGLGFCTVGMKGDK